MLTESKRLKSNAENILRNYTKVYIHRSKTAEICNLLSKVLTDNVQFANVSETTQLLKQLHQLFRALDQSHCMQTVENNPVSYVKDLLRDWKSRFERCVGMKMEMNSEQEERNDMSDIKDLMTKIDPSSPKLEEYKALLQEYEKKYAKEVFDNAEDDFDPNADIEELRKFEVDMKNVAIGEKIGSGGFADVFVGQEINTGQQIVLKKMKSDKFTKMSFDMFKQEVEQMTKIHHFAIIRLVGISLSPPFSIIMPYMKGGSLFARLHASISQRKLSPSQKTVISLGVACAMEYLHSLGIIHRDLKSANILLDDNDFPFLSDFGLSRIIGVSMAAQVGTSNWMAPEVLLSERYDEKSDVYSYAMVLWELLTEKVPFKGMEHGQIAMEVVNQRRPNIPDGLCSKSFAGLIENCWNHDPKLRPSFKQIRERIVFEHVGFTDTDWNKVDSYIHLMNDNDAAEPK